MKVDPGVPHRAPFTKYAAASERISISSHALARALRSRLFSASTLLIGRVVRLASVSRALAWPWLRRVPFPNVATGTPSLRAASCCPTDSASLTASTLNSSVYCRFGTVFSDVQTSEQTEN